MNKTIWELIWQDFQPVRVEVQPWSITVSSPVVRGISWDSIVFDEMSRFSLEDIEFVSKGIKRPESKLSHIYIY